MENKLENKIKKAMKMFERKTVKVTLSGIIESKFYIKNLKYVIEEDVLTIEDGDNAYLDIDMDDIENLYFESAQNGFVLLVLNLVTDLQIKFQVNGENVIPIRDRILNWIEDSGVVDELYKEACGA